MFTNNTNHLFPLFSITKCKLKEEHYAGIITSIDPNNRKGYGTVLFECDTDKRVTKADIHDAKRLDLAIF